MSKFFKSLLLLLSAGLFSATGWAAEAVNPKPVYLLDAGNTATEGWTTIDKNGSYSAFLQADTTYGELYATTTSGGNFFNTYSAPSVGFSEGTYEGLDGTTYSSVFEEMAATLGLESIPASVYSDNLQNGGASGHTLTVHGLDPEKCYVMYYIGGATKDNQTVAGFTLEASGYLGNPVLDYVCSSGSASHATSTVTTYANVLPVTTALRAASNGYLLVRVSYVKPTADGCLKFKLSGERANICALAIAEIDPQEDVSAGVAGSVNFSNVVWSPSNAKPNANVTLNVRGEATLTMDKTFLVNKLTVQDAGPLTIAKTESNKLIATTTLVNTDTTVEVGAASLGAVTIDADKTLTVKEGVALTSLSGSGTLNLDVGGSTTLGNYALNSFSGVTKVSSGTLKYTASANRPAGEIIVSGASAALQIADNTDILGWDSGLPGITIENDGRFKAFNRDTFSRVLTLNTGRLVFNADDQNSGRSFDLYSNSKIVSSGTSTIGGANATNDAESNDPIVASGIIDIRRSDLEIEVTDGTLSVYSAIGTEAGSGGSVYKKGAGTLAVYRAATSALPVVVDAGELRLVRKGSLTTGAMTVNANATLAYVGTQAPTNAITNNGTITADGEGTVADLTGATLSGSGTYDVKNGATLILKKAQADAGTVTVAEEATLKVKVDSYDTVTLDTVELAEGKNVVFVLPSGDEVIGTGATMPAQTRYTYTATAGEENLWSETAKWTQGGSAVNAVPSGTVTTPVEVVLTGATTLTMDVADVTLSALSVSGGDLTIAGENALTVKTVATANKVVVSGALILDAPGTEAAPTEMANVFEVAEGGTLTTKGYLNLTAENQVKSGGALKVASGVAMLNAAEQGIKGSLTIFTDATLKNSRETDALAYNTANVIVDVYGTLDMGATRWTIFANNNTINLYAGAIVQGAGQTGNGALDIWEKSSSTPAINIKKYESDTTPVQLMAAVRCRDGKVVVNLEEGIEATWSGNQTGIGSNAGGLKVDGAGTLKLTGTNTYTGGTEIAEGATIEVATIGKLSTSGAIVVNGRLRVNSGASGTDDSAQACGTAESPRLTGSGVLEFVGTNYYALPDGFTTPLAIENNHTGGIVVSNTNGMTIGTLSGNGKFRSDMGTDDTTSEPRVITVKQSAASTFSGMISPHRTSGSRRIKFLVTKAEGVAEGVDTTLTLAGNAAANNGAILAVAEGAMVKVAGEGSWGQSVVGAGTIIFEGKLPTGSGYTDEANWQGTVKLQNYTGSPNQGAAELNLDAYGSTASVVELANVTGWVGNGTVVPKLCLSEDGLTFNNGSTTSTATITVNALSGSGAIKGAVGKDWKYHVVVEDSTDFEGTIDLSETTSQCVSVVFGEGDAADGKIVIAQGTTIPTGKTWKAVNGVTVTEAATLSGTGTIASALTYSSSAETSFSGIFSGDLTVSAGVLEIATKQNSVANTVGVTVNGGVLRLDVDHNGINDNNVVFAEGRTITVNAGGVLELERGYGYFKIAGNGLTKVVDSNFYFGVSGGGTNNITTALEVDTDKTFWIRNWGGTSYKLTPASVTLNGNLKRNTDAGNGAFTVETSSLKGSGTVEGMTLALADNATIDVTSGVVTAGTVTLAGAVTVTGSVEDGDYILKCTNATAEDAAKITVEGFAVTADVTGYKAVAGGAVVDASLETTFTATDQTLTWSELVGDENAEKLYQGGTLTITFTAEGQTFTFDKDAALAFSQITINGEYAGTLAKTGTATVSATATAINTDTTVEAGVASLGTVTIADDKTLTVKDVNTVEAFATESQGALAIDATAGDIAFTAETTALTLDEIRQYSGKIKILGAEENGTTLAFPYDSGALQSQIEYVSGTHALNYGRSSGNGDQLFATGKGDASPTILVKNGATVNFAMKDLSGWNGAVSDTPAVIRVENGGTLNFKSSGGSGFFRDRLVLDGGAVVENVDNNFILYGGASEEATKAQIAMLDSDTPVEAEFKGTVYLRNANGGQAGTKGASIAVGNNATLTMKKLAEGTTEDTLRKLGGGTLKIQGLENVNVKFNVATGTLHFVTSYTSTSELSGAGVVMADGNGVELNFGSANCAAYTGTPIVQNGATLILPAGAENGMTVPADCTLKLVLSDAQQAAGYTMDLAEGSTATFVGADFTTLPDDEDGDPNTFTPALNTWTAKSGTAWETEENWSNGLPENGDSVAVEITDNTTLTLPGDLTVGTLVVKGSGTLTLASGKITATAVVAKTDLSASNETLTLVPMQIAEGVTVRYAQSGTENDETTLPELTGEGTFAKTGAGRLTFNAEKVCEPKIEWGEGILRFGAARYNNVYNVTAKDGSTILMGGGWTGELTSSSSTLKLEGGSTLWLYNGNVTHGSTVAAQIVIDATAEKPAVIAGSQSGDNTNITGTISGKGVVEIQDKNDNYFTISGVIANGDAEGDVLAVKVVTDRGVTFSGVNTFTGGLEIVEGGKLTVTQPGAMGTGGVVNNGALTFAFPAEGEGSYTNVFSGTGDYTLASGSLTWIFGSNVAVNALTVSGGKKMTIVPTVNNTSLNVNDAITIANGTLVIAPAPTATTGSNGVALATDASVTIGNGGALAFSGETACLFAHGEIGSSAITVEQGGTIYAGVNGIPFPVTLANGSVLDLYGYGVDVDGDFLTTTTLQLTKALTLPTGENQTVTVKLPKATSFLTYTGEAIEDWASRFVFTTSDGTPQTLEGVYLVDGGMGNVHNFTFASVVEIEGMSDAVAADIAQLVATLTAGEQLEVTEVVNADAAVCFEDIAYDYTLQEEVLQDGKVTLTYGFGVGDITVAQRTVNETTSNWIAVAVKVTDGGMGYGAENASPAALRSGTLIQLSKDGGDSYGVDALTPLSDGELTAAGLVNGEGVYWYWAEALPEIDSQATSTTVKYKVKAVNNGE